MAVVLVLFAALSGSAALAQAGIGARYGARDPVTCDSKKEPVNGPITPELAKRYFACDGEGNATGPLYLFEDIRIEIGPLVPFDQAAGNVRDDVDPNGPIYLIRGSFKKYQCDTVTTYSSLNNVGKSCNIYDSPHGAGFCYRTKFGDWRCGLTDPAYRQIPNQPPPR